MVIKVTYKAQKTLSGSWIVVSNTGFTAVGFDTKKDADAYAARMNSIENIGWDRNEY